MAEPMKVWRCPDHGPSVDPYRCFCVKAEEVEVIPADSQRIFSSETLNTIRVSLEEWGEQNCSQEDFTECGDPFCVEFAKALESVRAALALSDWASKEQR